MTDAYDKGRDAINRADEQRNPAPPGSKFEAIQDMEEIAGVPKIAGVKISGRGPSAIVDVLLGGREFIRFDRFDLMLRPASLEAAIVSHTGLLPSKAITKSKAAKFASCAFMVAKRNVTDELTETAGSWGARYLEEIYGVRGLREINMGDTDERRRVFSDLLMPSTRPSRGGMIPGDGAHRGYQQIILLDRDTGYRYVYRNWFRAWVKAEERIAPHNLAQMMLHVGWEQNGKDGYINARSREFGDQLNRRWYNVPPGWEHAAEEAE